MISDEVLFASATQHHDRGALADFFERHQLSVYRTCLGVLRRSDLAEDATQETFLTVIKQGTTVRPDGSVRGWLHRVAMNASLQVLRSERRRGRRERVVGMARLEAGDLPGEDASLPVDPAELRRHLMALPARWRVPLVLRYEQGLSYQEIAAAIGSSEGTVASRLHRALERLRESLRPDGIEATTIDLERTIPEMPPRRMPEELRTALRMIVASLPAPAPAPALSESRAGADRDPDALPWRAPLMAAAFVGFGLFVAWIAWTQATREPEIPPITGGGGQATGGGGVDPTSLTSGVQKALETYSQALRQRFLDATLNGQAITLLAQLNDPTVMPPSHQDKPAISRLASILTECQNKQPSYAEMNWKELEQRALELRNYPTVGKLADKLIEWTRAENTAKGLLGDGKDYMRSNRHDEAFSSFKKIENESVYARESRNKMLELKNIIVDRTAREANQKVRNGDFQSALDEINRVVNLLEGKFPDALVTLNPFRKECEKNIKHQYLVQEAELLVAQKKLDDAEAQLGSIDLGAPPSILAKVQKLREQIDVMRKIALAMDRYDSGDGKAALNILQTESHPDLVKLRTKIQKVVEATLRAQLAKSKNLFDEAARNWGEVLGLESDRDNKYYQLASKEQGGGPGADEAAAKAYERGAELQAAGQYGEARAAYEEAMKYFPAHEASVAAIKAFCRDAQKTYNFDKASFAQGKITLDVILPKFENILAFLQPSDGGVYTMYREAVEKLRTTGKF